MHILKNKLIILVFICMAFVACDDSDNVTPEDNSSSESTATGVSEGYVLYGLNGGYTTHLIDTTGTDVKTWTSSYSAIGGYYLSANKTLLRSGISNNLSTTAFANGGGATGIIEEIDDDNNVIWSYESVQNSATLHHDFKEINDSTIIALEWEEVTYSGQTVWNDNIIILNKNTNTIEWEWSAMDDGDILPGNSSSEDYIHFNSVDYDDGQILVSSFEQSTVYLIDEDSKEITNTFTAGGKLSNQHDATFLDNGNILVFNNKASSSASAVYEIDEDDNIVWQYSNDFYSSHISGAQRLSSGNTIICSGEEGRFIEVTTDGEEVWDYTPSSSGENTSGGGDLLSGVFKIRKYTSH